MPSRVLWRRSQRPTPTVDGDDDLEQPEGRVLPALDEGQLGRGEEDVGREELLAVAAEDGEELVGDDDRDADRHQRLAELLALHPAKEHDLQDDAEGRGGGDAGCKRDRPGVGIAGVIERVEDRDADIGADQHERAVRHVDGAHQPEDQREADRDDEVERRDGQPVQRHGQEHLQRHRKWNPGNGEQPRPKAAMRVIP